jgi:hypothetical protein
MNEYFNLLGKCHHSILSLQRKNEREKERNIKTITILIVFGLLRMYVSPSK